MYDVWKNVLAEIEQQLSAANFSTWFQDTSLLSTENNEIVIGVKNSFYIKQLEARYLNIIITALENNNIKVDKVSFKVNSTTKPKSHSREVTKKIGIDLKSRIKTIKTNNSPLVNNGLDSGF